MDQNLVGLLAAPMVNERGFSMAAKSAAHLEMILACTRAVWREYFEVELKVLSMVEM